MNLKFILKHLGATVFFVPGTRGIRHRSIRNCAAVVFYHYVGDPKPYNKLFYTGCTKRRFEEDLRIFGEYFDFVSLSELIGGVDGQGREERPRLAITFDDGFDLIKSGVVDILSQHRVRCTSFVITSCLENRRLMWRNILSAVVAAKGGDQAVRTYNRMASKRGWSTVRGAAGILDSSAGWKMSEKDENAAAFWDEAGMEPIEEYLERERPYFTERALSQWLEAGHGVGFHTHTHPMCSKLTEADLDAEIISPAARLRQKFGISWLPFSYPFGHRLPLALESLVVTDGSFACMLGIQGISRCGTPAVAMERANAEDLGARWVFLNHAMGAFRGGR